MVAGVRLKPDPITPSSHCPDPIFMFARKLYVEITTRCNMRCGMCIKHVPESRISNEDLDPAVFMRLIPHLAEIEELILNGIGEPLLHPNLVEMLSTARKHMPKNSRRGFQTNGILLDEKNSNELIDAGLNLLCISVDGSTCKESAPGKPFQHQVLPHSPVKMVDSIRKRKGCADFRLGGEVVLTRETLPNLPDLVRQLGDEGADFIIGSHLLAFQPENEASTLFDTNSDKARKIYNKYKKFCTDEGIELKQLTGKTWIAPRHPKEHLLKNIFKQMLGEARKDDTWLHVNHLETFDETITQEAETYYRRSYETAGEYGIELDLPPLTATLGRSCKFIRDKALFINTRGYVMPCHALWHDYTLHMNGQPKHFHAKSFGNIIDRELDDICTDTDLVEFRAHSGSNEFPYCHSCNPGPCPDITGEAGPFINDCFGIPVPCGHCLWCYDAIRCL